MAKDLNFWKTSKTLNMENGEIYSLLSDGESIDGLERLPIDKILNDVKKLFSDWECEGNTYFEKDEASFEVMMTEQFVRFDCYAMTEEDMNQIIDIMSEYGCPLYDSVIDVRFEVEEKKPKSFLSKLFGK